MRVSYKYYYSHFVNLRTLEIDMHTAPWKTILAALLFSVQPMAFGAEPAQEFNLPTDTGNVSLTDLKGKVIYLDFWASWCGPCRKSFPWMNDMQAKYKDQGLVVVGVNLDSKKSLAQEFLAKIPAKFTIAYDPEGKVADNYRVQGMPSSYVIDRNGNLQSVHLGFREKDAGKLENEIKHVLSASN